MFAFSGQNPAHNLTNIFHMNVLSNMPLEGLSSRVLHCSQLSPYTSADFNSFSKQSCLHTPCSFPLTVSCRLLSRNSVQRSGDLSLEQGRLEMWCVWSRYEQYNVCSWDFMLKRKSASYWIHDGSSPRLYTEHGATCANRTMRPDDLLYASWIEVLLHVLPDIGDIGLYEVGLRLKA